MEDGIEDDEDYCVGYSLSEELLLYDSWSFLSQTFNDNHQSIHIQQQFHFIPPIRIRICIQFFLMYDGYNSLTISSTQTHLIL